jgi:hypothetical protein
MSNANAVNKCGLAVLVSCMQRMATETIAKTVHTKARFGKTAALAMTRSSVVAATESYTTEMLAIAAHKPINP